MKRLCKIMTLVGVAAGCAHPVYPQTGTPITITVDTIRSTVLGDARVVRAALPVGYERSTAGVTKFPVLIVLDVRSDAQLLETVMIARALASSETPAIPGLIVVGVETEERRFHYTTPPPLEGPAKNDEEAGGAPRFARFLEAELYPFLSGKYRTWPFVVVVGHSMTGLFAAYSFGYAPNFIDAAIAISPSLMWNGSTPVEQVAEGFKKREAPGRLFVAAGSSESSIPVAAAKLDVLLRGSSSPNKSFQYHLLRDDTHYTSPLQGLIDGLRFVFHPVSLSGYGPHSIDSVESPAPASAMLQAYRQAKVRYLKGARSLGLPERLPDTFGGALGLWLSASGRWEAASEICKDAVAMHPDSWVGYECAGFALMRSGDATTAAKMYEKALQLAEQEGEPRVVTRIKRGLQTAISNSKQ